MKPAIRRQPPLHLQRGIALWLLLIVLLLSGSYAFYRSNNIQQQSRFTREGDLNLALAKAKEALIAYAVIDATRPGRLPCPDLVGDGVSPLLTRDDCDSYSGYLPWRTLDVQEHEDSHGANFRYVLSPLFGGDRNLPVLNSDTATSLRLDVASGQPSNEIVALIIATRGALDTRNADGDDYFYRGNSTVSDDNDLIVPVTRRELMAVVERRVAREVNNCLEQHATTPQNPTQNYPWPAPLAVDNFKGTPDSLFGQIPTTQPGNPDDLLKRAITDLKASKISLESASTAGEQLTALQALQSQAAYSRAFFDRLYIAALNLNTRATETKQAFDSLDAQLRTNTANSAAFTTGFAAVIPQIPTALTTLASLQQALTDSGIDLFVMEGSTQNTLLSTRITNATAAPSSSTFNLLLQQDNEFLNSYFAYSVTPNPEISAAISAALPLATTAAAAARAAKTDPSSAVLAPQATGSAEALRQQNITVLANAVASRYNIAAGEFSYRSRRISLALAALGGLPLDQARNQLAPILEEARSLTASLSTDSPALRSGRSSTLTSLDNALATVRSATDISTISSTCSAAGSQLTTLGNQLLANGENVANESLINFGALLQAAASIPPTNATAGARLRNPAKGIIYWSEVAITQSADVARQSKRGVSATNDSETSAYTAARQFLAKLDGSTGAVSALESHIATPGDTEKATTASARLAEATSLLATLIASAETLEGTLETGLATGVLPTVWYGAACKILAPAIGTTKSWWEANNWNSLIFYQISDRIRPATGQLTVNGQGAYRTVTIASGATLNLGKDPLGRDLQNRALRETLSFFEGRNTHASRDGLAKTPVVDFQNLPPSTSFNDRLAY